MAKLFSVDLNPLAEVFETSEFPHAQTLRSNLKQKFIATLATLAGRIKLPRVVIQAAKSNGNYRPVMEKAHIGILDIFDSPLTFVFARLMTWCVDHLSDINNTKKIAARVLIAPALVLGAAFSIGRLFLAAISTLVFSPLVLAIHLISKAVASPLKDTIKHHPVNDQQDDPDQPQSTWGQLLKSKKLKLSTIESCAVTQQKNGYDITFSRKRRTSSPLTPIPTFVTDSIDLKLTDSDHDKAVLQALRELNVGGLAVQLRQQSASPGQITHVYVDEPSEAEEKASMTM
jgi:hypothetical protein